MPESLRKINEKSRKALEYEESRTKATDGYADLLRSYLKERMGTGMVYTEKEIRKLLPGFMPERSESYFGLLRSDRYFISTDGRFRMDRMELWDKVVWDDGKPRGIAKIYLADMGDGYYFE
jgi:hypothetical protein